MSSCHVDVEKLSPKFGRQVREDSPPTVPLNLLCGQKREGWALKSRNRGGEIEREREREREIEREREGWVFKSRNRGGEIERERERARERSNICGVFFPGSAHRIGPY